MSANRSGYPLWDRSIMNLHRIGNPFQIMQKWDWGMTKTEI
jgi:hypothetical protein